MKMMLKWHHGHANGVKGPIRAIFEKYREMCRETAARVHGLKVIRHREINSANSNTVNALKNCDALVRHDTKRRLSTIMVKTAAGRLEAHASLQTGISMLFFPEGRLMQHVFFPMEPSWNDAKPNDFEWLLISAKETGKIELMIIPKKNGTFGSLCSLIAFNFENWKAEKTEAYVSGL